MFKVVEIAFVGCPVTDMGRARKFYESVLGLVPTMEHGQPDAAWIEYDIGSGTLAISNMAPEWKPSRHGPSAALEVDDLEAAVSELKKQQVPFIREPFTTPVCRMAIVADPDGNCLTLHQRHR